MHNILCLGLLVYGDGVDAVCLLLASGTICRIRTYIYMYNTQQFIVVLFLLSKKDLYKFSFDSNVRSVLENAWIQCL